MLETSVLEATASTQGPVSVDQLSISVPLEKAVTVRRELHRVQLRDFLQKLHGRFIGVDFVKQDGSERSLNGRLGVHSLCKGGVNKTVSDSRPYLTVFDAKAHEYRTLNLATVKCLRADRSIYSLVD